MQQSIVEQRAEAIHRTVVGYGSAALLLHIGAISEQDYVTRFKACSDYYDEMVGQYHYPLTRRIEDDLAKEAKRCATWNKQQTD